MEKDNSDIEPSNIYNILLLFLLTHICRPVQRTDPLEEFLEVWSPNQSLIPPCPTQFSSSLIKLDLTPIFYKGCCLITAFTTGENLDIQGIMDAETCKKKRVNFPNSIWPIPTLSQRGIYQVFLLFLFSHFSVRILKTESVPPPLQTGNAQDAFCSVAKAPGHHFSTKAKHHRYQGSF